MVGNGKGIAAQSHLIVALGLVVSGLVLILIANTFDATVLKVDLASVMANTGALLLIVGVLQWLFDTSVRQTFFREIRSEIIDYRGVAESGICEYHPNSKDVDFRELFLTSSNVIVGVNYSSKLIDHSIEILGDRTRSKKKTVIICVQAGTPAETFLEADFGNPGIDGRIQKIIQVAREHDPSGEFVRIVRVPTILRYSFIQFDHRIWVIPGTSGRGRRAVPGFFVRHGTSWFDHFGHDIEKLLEIGHDEESDRRVAPPRRSIWSRLGRKSR
jgi:hypothetical protein